MSLYVVGEMNKMRNDKIKLAKQIREIKSNLCYMVKMNWITHNEYRLQLTTIGTRIRNSE